MKDLFYSTKEKKLFYIAGYTDNSYNVKEIVSVLENQRKYFLKQVGLPEKSTIVNTDYITNSRRYKSMRYFWINDVEPSQAPKEAFVLNDDYWTMQKWIES